MSLSKRMYQYIVPQQQQTVSLAKSIFEEAICKALKFAKTTLKSGVRCKRKDLTLLYREVITTLDKESEKSALKFDKSLKCDILLYSFALAYEIFDEMEERYFEERNIRAYLEKRLRPKLESYFQNVCIDIEKQVLAATAIFEVLQNPIESALSRTMGSAVTGEMMTKSVYKSKGKFQASVLIKLGEGGTFTSYIPYFENPMSFLKMKLKESVENYCLHPPPPPKDSDTSLLEKEATKVKEKVLTAISTANELTKTGGGKLTVWIQQFVKNCSTLVIREEMFAVAAMNKDDLIDLDVLDAKLRDKVTLFVEVLINRGVDRRILQKWYPPPQDQLLTLMFGCRSCCPFCKVFCDQTVHNHLGSHCSRIHRPSGLVGYRDLATKKLCTTICTNNVASELKFRNADTSGEWHAYKDYQSVNDYYKSWSIPQDHSFEPSTYWQWFMATYSKELAEHYKVEQADIPEHWTKHTIKEVTEQLRLGYELM